MSISPSKSYEYLGGTITIVESLRYRINIDEKIVDKVSIVESLPYRISLAEKVIGYNYMMVTRSVVYPVIIEEKELRSHDRLL